MGGCALPEAIGVGKVMRFSVRFPVCDAGLSCEDDGVIEDIGVKGVYGVGGFGILLKGFVVGGSNSDESNSKSSGRDLLSVEKASGVYTLVRTLILFA